jgi:hypothetical protein
VWASVTGGGCAVITGLDQLQKSDCTDHCVDATTNDVTTDRKSDDAPVQGANDGPGADATDGAVVDSHHDLVADVGPDDAFDSGCGPLNDPDHCSACNIECAQGGPSQSQRFCNGVKCSYTCTAHHLDCNASIAPNTDGCECHTGNINNAQCCGTSCPVEHDNGLGQVNSSFFDCVTPNTYNLQLATDACIAFTGNPADCNARGSYQCLKGDAGTGEILVCSDGNGASSCVCWSYTNPNQGHVLNGGQKYPNCYCPQGGDPTYK